MKRETETDEALIERARAGDCSAFESLVSPHAASVRRVAYSFCRDRDAADDLAQDSLLRAFRSFGTFRGGNLRGWLFAVARSTCHDWYRQQRSRSRFSEVEFDEEQSTNPDDDLGDLLLAKHESERLWTAIRKLSVKLRVPLVLFEIEGLSYEEVANVEGIPVGTVRSRLSRARGRLVELLREPTAGGTFCDAQPSQHSRAEE